MFREGKFLDLHFCPLCTSEDESKISCNECCRSKGERCPQLSDWSTLALMSQCSTATWWMWWAAARCHLSPNEARTSGISAVNDPLTGEQIQLSLGFLNRHQVNYMRGAKAGEERRMGRRCCRGMRGAPSTKSNHIIQRDIVKGGERMATKWQKAETGTEILVPY